MLAPAREIAKIQTEMVLTKKKKKNQKDLLLVHREGSRRLRRQLQPDIPNWPTRHWYVVRCYAVGLPTMPILGRLPPSWVATVVTFEVVVERMVRVIRPKMIRTKHQSGRTRCWRRQPRRMCRACWIWVKYPVVVRHRLLLLYRLLLLKMKRRKGTLMMTRKSGTASATAVAVQNLGASMIKKSNNSLPVPMLIPTHLRRYLPKSLTRMILNMNPITSLPLN
mmetsp:Transcript_37178/g.75742  ORF Transcript_37178/g.75742 Transcript_37178/m.75742 type:complete len:222 (-) Transcript_37178:1852-2517(-)